MNLDLDILNLDFLFINLDLDILRSKCHFDMIIKASKFIDKKSKFKIKASPFTNMKYQVEIA